MSGLNNNQLKSFIERIERLEEEKAAIAQDVQDVFAEAKGQGFNTKIMKKTIALRKQDKAKRDEELALIDLYMSALGQIADTPLGQAALKAAVEDFE